MADRYIHLPVCGGGSGTGVSTVRIQGLSIGGRVTMITVGDTWTKLPSIPFANRNTLGIQNTGGAEMKINYEAAALGVRASGQATDLDDTMITFTADNIGIIGNSISLTFNGINDIDSIVLAWNTANPANTVSHDGVGTEIVGAQILNLSGGSEIVGYQGLVVAELTERYYEITESISIYARCNTGNSTLVTLEEIA